MSNPQLENGYLRIANGIIEDLAKVNLSPYEWRVLLAILRKTYGYNKKADRISLSQIEEATGITKPHISRALARLISRRIVARTGKNQLQFQKNADFWAQTLPRQAKSAPLPKQAKGIAQTGNGHEEESLPLQAPQKTYKDNNTKDNGMPSAKVEAVEEIQTLRATVGGIPKIDKLRISRPFSEWKAYLDQAGNKVGVLMEAFKTWHLAAPATDFEQLGPRMGALYSQADKDAGYLLRILWETAAADIAGSHLNYVAGKLRYQRQGPKARAQLPSSADLKDGWAK